MLPMVSDPWIPMLPDQSPDAVQVPALVEDQVKVEPPPLASPLIVTIADVVVPRDTPEAPAMATAKVLLPANGFALLMGITKDFGAVSRLPQLSEPCVAV